MPSNEVKGDNELYDLYKDAGLVPTEIVTNGIIAVICLVGIILNMLLVYVTVKSKPVMCTIGDPAHQPESSSMSYTLTSITHCAEFICYALIWLVNYFRKGHHRQSFAETEKNKRLMISLSVIMAIGLICFIGNTVFFIGIMPLLSLNIFTYEYIVWPISNGLFLMAYSSYTPVLFLCSTEYRKAFCKYVCRTEHGPNVVVPLRNMYG
ncbi:hypothetical protein niasHT_002252 [Heterodera trifolii]|uniref:G-protein coupled receptors family 1 profile domain-containing protein n=1 Tax=Heterodera trifolii TaxID=157864 RepID=A0ABD2MF11_9BILA